MYVLLLLFSTIITYIGGIVVERIEKTGKRKFWLSFVICADLFVLWYFKYFNMFAGYINRITKAIYGSGIELKWDYSIILPVGISFYTLQSIGYLIDVYRKEIYAERNVLKYALFISFFPQLVAGPIERSENLLRQLATPQEFTYDGFRRGILLMLYGFFCKVVIADRLAIFVNNVYSGSSEYSCWIIILATVLFSFQIYCDFYGYSLIAKGIAATMGIHLMENFNAPYYSGSIKEFWRRWHISLSTWFRDYLYIPLGGSRMGEYRTCINIIVVFAISGLWHGASFTFVIWGLIHGLYQVLELVYLNVFCKKFDFVFSIGTRNYLPNRIIKRIGSFILVCFAWFFFRANNLVTARYLLERMKDTSGFIGLFNGSVFELGISRDYAHVLIIAMCVLAIIDFLKYQGKDVVALFFQQNYWFRLVSELLLLLFVLLFGCYGSMYDVQQFVYFQF